MRIAILGAGAWGSALAINLSARHQISLWTKDSDHATEMQREQTNRRFLTNFTLPQSIQITAVLPEALDAAELTLIVVPIVGFRDTLRSVLKCKPELPILWGCKGFELETCHLPHQIVKQEYAEKLPLCGVLSGPSFAEEVARGLPTALTLASTEVDFSQTIASELHHSRLRIYTSDDVIGVETGGAIKNVITIAAGISDGIGFGHNARAALITRGLMEITRLGLGLGGDMKTFMGLAGLGDLILTCTGDLSRNRQVGLMLAAGKTLNDILTELGHVAEGVYTARSALELGMRLHVDMPITRAVCSILNEDISAREAVEVLLNREQKSEIY